MTARKPLKNKHPASPGIFSSRANFVGLRLSKITGGAVGPTTQGNEKRRNRYVGLDWSDPISVREYNRLAQQRWRARRAERV